jgi:hypothetical protein
MVRVHERTAGLQRLLRVEHEGEPLVGDAHLFGSVLCLRAAIGQHGRDPFARVARDIDRQRAPRHVGRVEAGGERPGRGCQLAPIEHIVDARHGEGGALVDFGDARRRIGAGDDGHVVHAGQRNVGGKSPLADDEAPVLTHPAVRRYEAQEAGHGERSCGRLAPRMRSAASAIASTIWA